MNMKALAPLGAAVVLGLIAAVVAKNNMSGSKAAAIAQAEVKIVTLKRDVAAGQMIAVEDVTDTALQSPVAPAGTFTSVNEVIGRVAIAPMPMGQPVLKPLLAPEGAVGGLQALVPNGMRAITIDVTETTSVGGLVLPGSTVDVLITLSIKANETMTRTLVQNVKVQAVGQRMGPAPKDAGTELYRSATLIVTPSQAEVIELACNSGRPRLVLRSSTDTADAQTTGVTLAELRGTRATAEEEVVPVAPVQQVADATTRPAPVDVPVPVREPRPRVVKVFKGGVESTVTFKRPAPQGAMVSTDTDVFAD